MPYSEVWRYLYQIHDCSYQAWFFPSMQLWYFLIYNWVVHKSEATLSLTFTDGSDVKVDTNKFENLYLNLQAVSSYISMVSDHVPWIHDPCCVLISPVVQPYKHNLVIV